MPIIKSAICSDCGEELDVKYQLEYGEDLIVRVEPCPHCVERISDGVYETGYDDGRRDEKLYLKETGKLVEDDE